MKINVISGPRNVSTALMYSFGQREDTLTVDEPFYAHYLNRTGADHPGREEVLNAQSIEEGEVITQLEAAGEDTPILFIKNMAHHLAYVSDRFLANQKNVFLIRDPREMLLSFIKEIPNPTLENTAYLQQYQLFQHVTGHLNQEPVVIDSAELLKAPAYVLERVCRKVDIPFDKGMLSWEKGADAADGVWAPYWYTNVHQSTGFQPYVPKEEAVPERLHLLLQTCERYYGKLYEHAIKAET